LQEINRLTPWLIIEPKIITFVSKRTFSKDGNWEKYKSKKIVVMESLTDE
jgi:hypothetical protein